MWRTLTIAVRSLVRYRRRSLLAGAAVFLGVFAVTAMRGVLNGVQHALDEEVVLGEVGMLQVHRAGWAGQVVGAPLTLDLPADDAFLGRIGAVQNVRAAAPRIRFGGMIAAGDRTLTTLLTAVDPVREREVCPRRADRLGAGRMLAGGEDAVLAAELARRLGVLPGAQVAVVSPDRDGSMNAANVTVSGTVGLPGAPGIDSKTVLVPLALAQELLRMPARATEIAVRLVDRTRLEATRQALGAALGADYEVTTWYELAPTVRDVVALQDRALGVVSGILLFVALLGVVNTMLMGVLERTREIGTMMALGLRRGNILALFLTEATLLGLFSALPALGLGVGLVTWLGHRGLEVRAMGGGLLHLHPAVSLGEAFGVVLLACVGAMGAALYPSWKASRLRPVEALGSV